MPAHAGSTTRTVPCIVGWIWQKYSNVPGLSNAVANSEPGSIVPESNEPSRAVTVWAVGSSFRHVTSVPLSIADRRGGEGEVPDLDPIRGICLRVDAHERGITANDQGRSHPHVVVLGDETFDLVHPRREVQRYLHGLAGTEGRSFDLESVAAT